MRYWALQQSGSEYQTNHGLHEKLVVCDNKKSPQRKIFETRINLPAGPLKLRFRATSKGSNKPIALTQLHGGRLLTRKGFRIPGSEVIGTLRSDVIGLHQPPTLCAHNCSTVFVIAFGDIQFTDCILTLAAAFVKSQKNFLRKFFLSRLPGRIFDAGGLLHAPLCSRRKGLFAFLARIGQVIGQKRRNK